jgi:hypothetical protein
VIAMHFNPNLINVNSNPLHSNGYPNSSAEAKHEAKSADILNENVKRGIGQATGASAAGLQLGDKKSAEDVAKTMLDHVQRGLEQLRAQGASEQRIEERLSAAKAGIAKGYEQAEQQLKDMGLMNDDLQSEIDRGRELISQGLEGFDGLAANLAADPQQASNSDTTRQVGESRYSSMAMQSNTMTLDLVTRDGDKVSLSFSQQAKSYGFSVHNAQQSISASGFEQGLAWQMDVVGNLDEGEQEALSNLLSDIEKLSSSFFAGDLGNALDQAMQLGFDGNELASMSLNLRQESFSSVSRAYNSVQPKLPTPELEQLSSPLLAYNHDYLSALEQAKSFADPEKLIDDLVDQLFPDDHLKGIFQAYNQGLRAAVDGRASLMEGLLT